MGSESSVIRSLREAVLTVPIPGAPPRLSRDGAAVGLAFLDMVLRQNYVRRLTERLYLVEHQAARCTTEVDISLGLLDDGQREAGLLYQRLRRRMTSSGPAGPGDEPAMPDDVIWVPMAKVSRQSQSPIEIINGDGAKLPRLTQHETSRLLASALYRLFKVMLDNHPDARVSRLPLHDFLFRSEKQRWLLQAALAAMLTERGTPAAQTVAPQYLHGMVPGEGARLRRAVLEIVDRYGRAPSDYADLLDVAVNDTLLVVALDPRRDEHSLVFESPLRVEAPPGHRSWKHALRLASGTYWVQYNTRLPASLRTYHLVAETQPDIHIETMYLASDADHQMVDSLSTDLKTLAHRVAGKDTEAMGPSARKPLELELQACLRMLSELIRRRRWEALQAGFILDERHGLPAAGRLAFAVTAGEATVDGLGRQRNSLLRHPYTTVTRLSRAADEIAEQELSRDLSVENDPARAKGHVYWRRDPSRTEVDTTIHISSGILLRDSGRSRLGTVIGYVTGVTAIAYVLGCFMFGTLWPFPGGTVTGDRLSAVQADAVIAVLLLVPGFLYTRLRLPDRHSIAGQLQRLPRAVAQATIVCAAGLAAAVAAGQHALYIQIALAVCVVVPPAVLLLAILVSGAVRSDLLLIDNKLPRWARSHMRPKGTAPTRKLGWLFSRPRLRRLFGEPDAVFSNSGVQP